MTWIRNHLGGLVIASVVASLLIAGLMEGSSPHPPAPLDCPLRGSAESADCGNLRGTLLPSPTSGEGEIPSLMGTFVPVEKPYATKTPPPSTATMIPTNTPRFTSPPSPLSTMERGSSTPTPTIVVFP